MLPDTFHQSLEGLELFPVLLQLHLHPCIIMLEEENILVSILLHLRHVLLQTGYLILQHVSTPDGVVGGSVAEAARVGARLSSQDLDVGIQGG